MAGSRDLTRLAGVRAPGTGNQPFAAIPNKEPA